MRLLTTSTILATTLLAPVAQADFVITGQPTIVATPQATTIPDAEPAPQEPDPVPDPSDPPHQPKRGRRPPRHWQMAHGFGHQIPLAFAVKQIVPPAVKVTYGPDTDPQERVDWKGGDTWNHVLRNAVQPIGLHLVMTPMAVEIRQ